MALVVGPDVGEGETAGLEPGAEVGGPLGGVVVGGAGEFFLDPFFADDVAEVVSSSSLSGSVGLVDILYN